MNKIYEIGKAWTNVFVGSDEVKALAEQRMAVCQSCEHKGVMGTEVCNLCFCPLLGKTHSPVNSCPAKKWLQ